MSFDDISRLIFGRPSAVADLRAPCAEFFFPDRRPQDHLIDLRERMVPAFLDLLTDLVNEDQKLISINQWMYHIMINEYMISRRGRLTTLDVTCGLKEVLSVTYAFILEHARGANGVVDPAWLAPMMTRRLPRLHEYMTRMYPGQEIYHKATLKYNRILSNLTFIHVSTKISLSTFRKFRSVI